MLPETIDLCSRYDKLVRGYQSPEEAKLSDIRNHYMSSALLNLPNAGQGKHFFELIEKAVFDD